MADVEVLVVGAGPTGLTLAVDLARRGVGVRLVDQATAPSPLSKAIVLHARTLEVAHDLGVADALCARGHAVGRVRMFADGRAIVEASFEELETRYPFALSIPQAETEAVLAHRLTALGGRVERGVSFVGLAQEDGGVRASLRHADGRVEETPAPWLVGCDGAHSAVRKACDLDFAGETFPECFWLADLEIGGELPHDQISTFFHQQGTMVCIPLPGGRRRYRIIATAPEGEAADRRDPPSLAEVQALCEARAHLPMSLSEPSWLARFGINTRQVSSYRAGRVFLAGDAAHIHSPLGGQGLNTGLQDAHNLAWKLALVAKRQAREELLDSYHAERHAVGKALLRATELATRVATLRHPLARALRDRVAKFMSSIEVVQARLVRTTAELDLDYRSSPIVAEQRTPLLEQRVGGDEREESASLRAGRRFAAGPTAGDQAPDGEAIDAASGRPVRLCDLFDGRRHTLLLFDGRAATEDGYRHLDWLARRVRADYDAQVAVHIVVPRGERPPALAWDGSLLLDPEGELEERFGAVAECLYLIRPDLYVGYRSQPADEVGLMEFLRGYLLQVS